MADETYKEDDAPIQPIQVPYDPQIPRIVTPEEVPPRRFVTGRIAVDTQPPLPPQAHTQWILGPGQNSQMVHTPDHIETYNPRLFDFFPLKITKLPPVSGREKGTEESSLNKIEQAVVAERWKELGKLAVFTLLGASIAVAGAIFLPSYIALLPFTPIIVEAISGITLFREIFELVTRRKIERRNKDEVLTGWQLRAQNALNFIDHTFPYPTRLKVKLLITSFTGALGFLRQGLANTAYDALTIGSNALSTAKGVMKDEIRVGDELRAQHANRSDLHLS